MNVTSLCFDQAEARFKQFRQTNIVCQNGDGTLGWPGQAPFERIMVTAAVPDIPPHLAEQLSIDGKMVLPVGEDHDHQTLLSVTRTEDGFDVEELEDVRFVPLLPGLPE